MDGFRARALLLCTAVALLTGACGTSPDTVKANPAKKADPIEFSRCMREHGVPGFPDLDANGDSVGTPESDSIDPKSPAFQAAEKACAALKPAEKTHPDMSKYRNDQIRYSKCMRDNGITGFPDPNSDGNVELNPATTGIDPKSEQFAKAEKACRPLLVVPPGARAPQH